MTLAVDGAAWVEVLKNNDVIKTTRSKHRQAFCKTCLILETGDELDHIVIYRFYPC